MKKSTQQIETELPEIWNALQETSCDQELWDIVNDAQEVDDRAVGVYVDYLEDAAKHLAHNLNITKVQALLILAETAFCRFADEGDE